MRRLSTLAALAAIFALAPALAQDDLAPYYADGKLTQTLEVRDVQGGFAGFTGWQYKIEPEGRWTVYQVFNEKLTPKADGKLDEAKLKRVAKSLAEYDALKLKNFGRPVTNPHVVTVQFGERVKAVINWKTGDPLPRPEPGAEAGLPERFGGILAAVQAVTKKEAEE